MLERHALPRKEYGDILPGPYPLHLLEPELADLVRQLIAEHEQNFTTTPTQVDDAELVDDTTEEN